MTKKVVNFLGEERCTPRENPGYAYMKKGPRLTVVWGPRMVNPAVVLHHHTIEICDSALPC